HLELVRESDLRRFAKLGATANLQPLWAAHDAQLDTLVLPFLPEGAQAGLYPFASLAAAGARLAMGSDWPASSPDPLQAIHVGVNRSHPRPATRGAQALAATPPPEFRPTLPPALHPSDALSLAQL